MQCSAYFNALNILKGLKGDVILSKFEGRSCLLMYGVAVGEDLALMFGMVVVGKDVA